MKINYRILFLLAIILFATPLQADTTAENSDFKWCNRFVFNAEHPMYQDLEANKKELQGASNIEQIVQRERIYRRLLEKFDAIYASKDDFKDERVQITIRALRLYISDLATKGERPTIWNAVHFGDMNEIRLQGIGPSANINEALEFSCSVFERQDLNSAVLGVAYLSRHMEALSRFGLRDLQEWAAAEAVLINNGYRSWILKGLAQWPWEMKVNELWIPNKFNEIARDWQLTILRPNLGFAVNPNDSNDATLDYALMLEPVGFVKYLKNGGTTDYEHWLGVSALVSVTDDNGTGYGLMARYDNFMLGTCIHDSQDQDWLIYLGVDLYKYLLGDDGKVKQYQELVDKYRISK